MALGEQLPVGEAPFVVFLLYVFLLVHRHASLSFFKVDNWVCNCARGKPTFIIFLFLVVLFFHFLDPRRETTVHSATARSAPTTIHGRHSSVCAAPLSSVRTNLSFLRRYGEKEEAAEVDEKNGGLTFPQSSWEMSSRSPTKPRSWRR